MKSFIVKNILIKLKIIKYTFLIMKNHNKVNTTGLDINIHYLYIRNTLINLMYMIIKNIVYNFFFKFNLFVN